MQPYELAGGFHSALIVLPNAVLDLSSFVWTELFVYRLVFSHTPTPSKECKTVVLAQTVPFKRGRVFPEVMALKIINRSSFCLVVLEYFVTI